MVAARPEAGFRAVIGRPQTREAPPFVPRDRRLGLSSRSPTIIPLHAPPPPVPGSFAAGAGSGSPRGTPGAQSWSSGCRSSNSCPGDPRTQWGGTPRAQTPLSIETSLSDSAPPEGTLSCLLPGRAETSSLWMPPSLPSRPWVNNPLASSRHYSGLFRTKDYVDT